MITVTHYTSEYGWEFEADQGGLRGGGRTLSESVASSEHSARRYLSAARGTSVPLSEARGQLCHATGSPAPAKGVAA